MVLGKILNKNYIFKTSVMLAGITMFAKVLGYIEKLIVAYFWGTDYQADTYYAIVTIIIGISLLFREVTEPAFLNLLIKTHQKDGKKEFGKAFTSVFWLVTTVGFILSLAFFVFPGKIITLFLSGFTDVRYDLSVFLLKLSSIALFFLIICTITNTCLLSRKQYLSIAISDIVYKSVIIITLTLAAGKLGITTTVIAVGLGALCKFLFQLIKIDISINSFIGTIDKKYIIIILFVSWPLLVGNIFSQLGAIIQNTFASYMETGSLSALSYAKKIIDLPVVIFPYTLSMIVFPYFSQMSVENDKIKMRQLLNNCIKYILLFFIPLTIFMAFFPNEIVSIIFARGAFGADSTFLTSAALSIYNIGMISFSLETILVIFLFAKGKIKLPVAIGIICVIFDIIITLLLIKYLNYLGICLGYVISRWVKTLLLLYFIRSDLNPIKMLSLKKFYIWIISTGFFSLITYIIKERLLPLSDNMLAISVILGISAIILFSIYLSVLYKAKIIDIKHG